MATSETQSGGIGGLTLFFLVLFVLKVCGPLAEVSWWWITAPVWIPFAIVILVLLLVLVAAWFSPSYRKKLSR